MNYTVKSMQKNNCYTCGKRSMMDTGNYYITHVVCRLKIPCNVATYINCASTLQLMTIGFLSTAGFQNFKYQNQWILVALLYSTVPEITMFSVKLPPDFNSVRWQAYGQKWGKVLNVQTFV